MRFIRIDEDGYFLIDEERLANADLGAAWLGYVRMDGRCRAILALPGEEDAVVEAFDEPYVALALEAHAAGGASCHWIAQMPYHYREPFALSSLTVDEWDRFHGRTERGVPFVLSRPAQAAFFDMADEFDDDGITIGGNRIDIGPWLSEAPRLTNVRGLVASLSTGRPPLGAGRSVSRFHGVCSKAQAP